jgi:type II secretory pathway pseudopilin PulG
MFFLPFRKRYRYIRELLCVILIIGILAATAIKSYMPCISKAHVISVTGAFDTVRRDNQIYYALHGEWPKDISQAIKCGLEKSYKDLGSNYQTDIENGAISFTFNMKDRRISEKTITMRPVVQADDPFGPVHWVCGDKDGAQGWTIYGADRTSVEDQYIPWSLR